jgi:ribosome-binding ATPase YchF (GTP1/OBG family)
VRAVYDALGLVTFFTMVGVEVGAWPVKRGTGAARAAGRIHSDMERGFIRAEVVPLAVLLELGSEQAARDRGALSVEGREYQVRDGDVVRFKFRS